MASLTCMQNYLNTIFVQVTRTAHTVAIAGISDTHCKTQKSHDKVKIMLIDHNLISSCSRKTAMYVTYKDLFIFKI